MNKLAFVGNSEPPAKLLELFRKQTPGNSGCWGNLQGIDNYEQADYFGVIDVIPNDLRNRIREDKCVFLGAHPETMQAYRDMSSYKGIKMYDLKYNSGFLEWWIKYDYDMIKALQPPTKTEVLGAIVSNARTQVYHTKRLDFLERFCYNVDKFNLYGRINPTGSLIKHYKYACGSIDARGASASGGNDHMSGKEEVYLQHKYMIEFDATGEHYFSERVLDCLFLWSLPIYWGGNALPKYLPEGSYFLLDINGNGDDIKSLIKTDFYERNIDNIAKARNILLDELQLWPRIHQAIYSRFK